MDDGQLAHGAGKVLLGDQPVQQATQGSVTNVDGKVPVFFLNEHDEPGRLNLDEGLTKYMNDHG